MSSSGTFLPIFHEVVDKTADYGFLTHDIVELAGRPLEGPAAQADALFVKKQPTIFGAVIDRIRQASIDMISVNGPIVGVTWRPGDIKGLEMGRKFDAIWMIFAVLGQQHTNTNVLAALSVTRKHLSAGSLLIVDSWYRPAVLDQKSGQRVRMLDFEQDRIVRFASGELGTGNHVCHIHYNIWWFEGNRLASETEETRATHFYFPFELRLFLQNAGFSMIEPKEYPGFSNEPTWNAMVVAQAI